MSLQVPASTAVIDDAELLRLMRVYRETIDGREGEMATRIDRPKRQRMIDLIYRLRDEACALTGLR